VHAIAKTRRKTVSEVNEAIDRWADSTITDKTREHTLALELEVFCSSTKAFAHGLQCHRLRCRRTGVCVRVC
jgi:hypothetical protein